MARIRTIKPEFPQSESMGRVSRDARLLFVNLWTICDDEGKARGNSRMLASLLYPYDDDAKDLIEGWLAELEREKCIIRYRVDGGTYLQIAKWLDHQKIDKPSKSRLPQFDESSRSLAKTLEPSTTDLGPRTLDLGPKDNAPAGASIDDEFKAWYSAYPLHKAPQAALKAYQRARKKADAQTLLDAIAVYRKIKPEYADWAQPATWLNQERWLDEAPTGPPVATIDPEKVFRGLASMVAKGIRSTKATITQDDLTRMVTRGLVTVEQATKYGWVNTAEPTISVPRETLRAMGVM